MRIELIVIINLFGLMIEILFTLFKNKYLSFIPMVLSSILFIITKKEFLYILAFIQIIICFVSITVQCIIKEIIRKRKNNEVEKSKIKDLM